MNARPDLQALADHPAVARISAEVAALQRDFYGRRTAALALGAGSVQVVFQHVAATQVEMQWRVRCAGNDFELQFVEPAALFDLGNVLAPSVPVALQRAAMLHAASDLFEAFEGCLGAAIELIDLSGPAPAWDSRQVLGLCISRNTLADHSEQSERPERPVRPVRRCAMLLRALTPGGWQRLGSAARLLTPLPPAHDARLDIAVCAESVPLTVGELRQLEPGDLLVLDAAADELLRPTVSMRLDHRPLPGVLAWLADGRVRISRVDPAVAGGPAPADPPAFGASHHFPWNATMNLPNAAALSAAAKAAAHPIDETDIDETDIDETERAGVHPLDAVQVEVEIELARLSLPLSALRSLAVGQVFDTAQPVDGDGIVLWCGGQRLGNGQLVAVGDRLAVRVTALSGAPPTGIEATPTSADARTPRVA